MADSVNQRSLHRPAHRPCFKLKFKISRRSDAARIFNGLAAQKSAVSFSASINGNRAHAARWRRGRPRPRVIHKASLSLEANVHFMTVMATKCPISAAGRQQVYVRPWPLALRLRPS